MDVIEKLSNMLLTGSSQADDCVSKLSRIIAGVFNLFGLTMTLLLLVLLIKDGADTVQTVFMAVIASGFGALHFLTGKIGHATASKFGLVLVMLAAALSLILLPDRLMVHHAYAFMIPAYGIIGYGRRCAGVISITTIAAIFITCCISSYVDISSFIVLALGMMLTFTVVAVPLYACTTADKSTPNTKSDADPKTSKKQDLITKLSYHIRTPLSNILGIANMMSTNDNPDNKKQLVDSLIASVETITDVFDIINGETEGKPFGININDGIRFFDLKSLITQTAELTPGIEVKLEVYGELPRLKGNSVKMRRIMLNIYDFFLQYTPKENLPAQVTIVVNRVRIPIKPIKYRFDVKTDYGIPVLHGGDVPELGIAKRIIEELGGNIKQRFEDDSSFIYFNVCFDDEEDVKPQGAAATTQKPMEVYTNETAGFTNVTKAKTLDQANIIVCDDNPINQKVMSLSLDKHVKAIALASNGQECVELVTKGNYDLILMDIQMPVMDGYEATRQIRRIECNTGGHIPIIAVTANAMSGDRQICLSTGMDDYVSKPFQIDDVIKKMNSQLNKDTIK